MPNLSRLPRAALVVGALLLVTGALYWPVRHHDFIWLDDPDYVTENAFVRMGLSWPGFVWAFTHTFSSNWHPLTWLSHMLDWQLFGANAGGHHLVNVLFHAVNSVLLWGLLRRATGAFWRPAIVAALFAWHPTHVESVAWIAERKDVLSTFFGLLTLLAYTNYVHQSKVRGPKSGVWYGLALGLFACGLMSKPMLVTWPCVMLLLDYWPLRRMARPGRPGAGDADCPTEPFAGHCSGSRLVLEKLPFVVLVVASCAMTIHAQDKWGSLAKAGQLPLVYRAVNAVVSYTEYPGKLLWPTDLAIFYPFRNNLPWERALYCGLGLAAVTAMAVWRARAWPFWFVGWWWYLGTLVPVIGLVQVGGQAMADRYTYIPSIGFFIAVVWLGAEFASKVKWGRAVAPALAGAAVAACFPMSARQIATWKDSRTVFEQACRATTGNFVALNTLGEILRREGKLDEALNYFRQAAEAGPGYPLAWSSLGLALYASGHKQEGIRSVQKALEINPDDSQSLLNLGQLLIREQRFSEAEAPLRHALEVRPGFAEAHVWLGGVLGATGRGEEAFHHFAQAVAFKPNSPMMRMTYGAALAKAGRYAEAIAEYEAAVGQDPRNPEAQLALGAVLTEAGQPAAAEKVFQTILAMAPTNAAAQDGLAFAVAQQGRPEAALALYQRAVEIAPSNSLTRLHLAMLHQQLGADAEAVAEYRRAIAAEPPLPAAWNNLAWLLATHPDDRLRDGAAAVELARRACELTHEQEPIFIGTLAAAYAEAGKFGDAVAAAERARKLAQEAGLEEIARRNGELLELYRSGKAYRESRATSAPTPAPGEAQRPEQRSQQP